MAKLLSILVWPFLILAASLHGAEKPVWLASNGFHTSIGLRTVDLPFARQIGGGRGEDKLLIGWGASEFYQGDANCATLLWSFFPGPSALHVVPIHGPIAGRFSHSDVIRLQLTPAEFAILIRQIGAAFARDKTGRPILAEHPGYYPDSHFYRGSERFYFPNMCNMWLAAKLRRSGLPIHPGCAIMAHGLIRQAARLGQREGTVSKPHDGY